MNKHTDKLTPAVAAAIAAAPGSRRALAHEAGVSDALLTYLVKGQRAATPEVAHRIAAALGRWAVRCQGGAGRIRRAAARRGRR